MMQLLKYVSIIAIGINISCNTNICYPPASHLASIGEKGNNYNCTNYNFFLSEDLDSARILLDKNKNRLIYISKRQIEVDELTLIKNGSNDSSYKAYYIMGQNQIIDSTFFKIYDKEIIQEYNGKIFNRYNLVYDTCLDSPELFLMKGGCKVSPLALACSECNL